MNTAVNPATRAAIYARYSSDMQRSASIEDQDRNCRKRAVAEGWMVVSVFSDAAISGSDNSRTQYRAMLAAAERGEFNVLLLDDLSRLARDSVEQERTIRRLEFMGIRIIATGDGYDSESKARKVHRGFKGLMNEIFLDDLKEKTHRGQEGQARKGFWTGGRPFGYKLKPILDPAHLDQYGQPVKIGSKLQIDSVQAEIVREIYRRFADGESHRQIAAELNRRNVASPGSTWRRSVRRCSGWAGSAICVITRAPIYGGLVRWNAHEYVTNPETGKYSRRKRPQSEWVEYRDESLRIISDELIERARNRTTGQKSSDQRIRAGGKTKYLLSGLLHCGCCDHNYTMAAHDRYACGRHRDGKACNNDIYVARADLESAILGPIREDLLSPHRVEMMGKQIEAMFAERVKSLAGRVEQRPQQLAELDARIERLRERQRSGDPDLTTDELQGAINRVVEKRRELEAQQPGAKRTAAVLSALPRAAALYRQQIEKGLDGDPRAASKARVILRQLFGGKIVLRPGPDRSLYAEFEVRPSELVREGTGGGAEGNRGWQLSH